MIEALSPEQLRRKQMKERADAAKAAKAEAAAAAAAAARAAASAAREAEFMSNPAIIAAARMPVYNPLAVDIPLLNSSGDLPTGKLPSSFLEGEYGFKEDSSTDFMSSACGGGSAANAMARSSTMWSSGSGSGIGSGNGSGSGSSGMHGLSPLSPPQHRGLDYSELNIDSPNNTGGSAFEDEDGGLSSAAAAA
eukprot:5919-Heterococcus_DN1.PRE.3